MTSQSSSPLLRPLSQIEEALTITGLAWPLVAVCVLRLNQGPSITALRSSLDLLQRTHPLLNAEIISFHGRFWFKRMMPAEPIPLLTEKRRDDNYWLEAAQKEVNLGFDHQKAPLMRIRYLTSSPAEDKSEIILSVHHAIADTAFLQYIADQLLTLSSECESAKSAVAPLSISSSGLSPLLGRVLPRSLRGPGLCFRMFTFLIRQIRDERMYRKVNREVKEPSIPASPLNDLHVLTFSEEETSSLVKWSRANGISVNSMIAAAMLLVMNGILYPGRKRLHRTVQFVSLRPWCYPPVEAEKAGAFISLMRFTVPVSPESDVATLASCLDHKFLRSARRGEKFLSALLSKMIMKKTIREHRERLGTTALSYAGTTRFKNQYGRIQLNGIHGFITNNCQGALLTGFAKIFSGRLSMDMNTLSEEIPGEKAGFILKEIKSLITETIAKNE